MGKERGELDLVVMAQKASYEQMELGNITNYLTLPIRCAQKITLKVLYIDFGSAIKHKEHGTTLRRFL